MRDGTMGAHPLNQDDYDWQEAFGFANGEDGSYTGGGDFRRAHPQDVTTPLTAFGRKDVEEIAAYSEGENDGESWLAVGRLKDGRWFLLSAWCDYTGWDCQSGGTITLAPDKATLLNFGMTDEEKKRLDV